ncbi:MAG: PKD domain-containing protein, partial [Dehalococcoidia bacterium]
MAGNEGNAMGKPIRLTLTAIWLVVFFLGAACAQQEAPPQATSTPSSSPEPIQVEFRASVTSGEAPLTVGFTDLSTGDATDWWWFFGDGQSSTERSPTHTYSENGLYSVSLVATGRGEPRTLTKDDYVRVGTKAPGWILRTQKDTAQNIDVSPKEKSVVLDLAGE